MFPVELLDLRTTLPPVQKVVGPAGVMTGVAGVGFAVTTTGRDVKEVHPATTTYSVTVWEVETVFVVPPGELFQWLPLAELEVRVTDPGVQKVVGPPGVIVGVAGKGFTVTTTGNETA